MSKKKTNKKVNNHNWVSPLVLGTLVIGTLLLRIIPGWDQVIVDGQVLYREVDAWYHMRLIDNMMINFPFPLRWDMLILFPDGMNVGYFPLLSWTVVILGKIFGHYELIGAFLPPIIGALSLIPIYFICKTLWKDWVGWIACGLLMVLPSEFFHRTLLGFTDHHMLEILFMPSTILFLILFSKEGKLKWVVLSGIFLGLYLSCWGGGSLLISLVWLWFFIKFLLKSRSNEQTRPFCLDVFYIFGISILIFLPNIFFIEGMLPYIFIFLAIAISPLILYLASKKLDWKKILAATLLGIGLVLIVVRLTTPTLFLTARSIFVSPTSVIQEAQPVTLQVIIAHYGITFILFVAGLVLGIKNKENLILLVWSILILILGVSQRRWSYYFSINIAILAGYFLFLVYGWVHKSTRKTVIITTCIMVLLVIIKGTIGISNLPGIITPGWYNACSWLRSNTPDTGTDYYALNASRPSYGILSWWDFGDFICRLGHRAPCSSPMIQTPDIQWQVFLAPSEEEANSYLTNIDYIMVDQDMVGGKLYAIKALAPEEIIVDDNTFIMKLWNGTSETWRLIFQVEEVRIYGRV